MSPKRKPKSKKTNCRKICNSRISYITSRVGWVNLSLVAILVAGTFVYLVQLSVSATKGFIISELQTKVSQHEDDVRRSEQQVHKLKSVEHIAREAERLQMVVVNEVDFMQPLTNGVALGE